MRPSEQERINCPYCGELYYPFWISEAVKAPPPNRRNDQHFGRIWATTCTVCGQPIVELKIEEGGGFIQPSSTDSVQVFPTEPATVIKIIVQIILKFEKVHRQETGKKERTEKEEKDRSDYLSKVLSVMWDVANKGAGAARIIGQLMGMFDQQEQIAADAEETAGENPK